MGTYFQDNAAIEENISPNSTRANGKQQKIQEFIDAQKSKNTVYKTKSDLNIFSRYLAKEKEDRKIESIPVDELDTHLADFFMTVRKQNGDEYEPSSLSSTQRSIQRHLDDQMSNINILKNDEFKQSRNALAAKRRQLVSKGKGNRPQATRALTESEEDKLFEGFFGDQEPRALQRAMWWFVSLHFGFRARDESRKLCWGDVILSEDPDSGAEMLVWQAERGSKTRQGQVFSHQRAFNPTFHATNQDRCPVKYYKSFRDHRPPEMNSPESPFFLAVKTKRSPNNPVWFMKSPLGKNELGNLLGSQDQYFTFA